MFCLPLLLILWLPIQEQETDNSGTYGGQEVMQINVSQHQYFLALRSPCREEVWGQLSIIGPQLISEEGLMREREGDERKRCWGDIRSERAGPLNHTGGEAGEKLTKHTEGKDGAGSVLIHVLHIHDGFGACIPTLHAIFALVLLPPFYLCECVCPVFICCVLGCQNIAEDVQQACKCHALFVILYSFISRIPLVCHSLGRAR